MNQSFEDGKYRLEFDEKSGKLLAYRHGEFWQDFSGNKLIYLMMAKIDSLTEQLEQQSIRSNY